MLKKFFCILIGISTASVISSGICMGESVDSFEKNTGFEPNPVYVLDEEDYPSTFGMESFYYSHLTHNFGHNYKQSCGYVAIGMLLSYYDTFLNDSIIPDQYDIASIGTEVDLIRRNNNPGVLFENISDVSSMSNITYFEHVTSMNNSFHGRLLEIGDEAGFCPIVSMQRNGNTVEDMTFGTSFNSRKEILNRYFRGDLGYRYGVEYSYLGLNRDSIVGNLRPLERTVFDSKYRNAWESNSNEVRSQAIQLVKQGYPVIIGGTRIAEQRDEDEVNRLHFYGHAVVAYDYDEATDSLYCHMGWSSITTHSTLESWGYTFYRSALAVKFNIPYSPSDNYGLLFLNGNIEYFSADKIADDFRLEHKHNYSSSCDDNHDMECICGNKITNHNYTDHYEKYDDERHKAYCRCGRALFKKHSYTDHYKNNGPTQHYAYCVCGEYVEEDHSYGDHFETYNKKQHKAYCECGAYVLRPHVAKASAMGGLRAMRYAVCEDCGELIDLGTTPIIAYL